MQLTDQKYDFEAFVIQSGSKYANNQKLVESLVGTGLLSQVTFVQAGVQPHELKTQRPWFAIFFDDEVIDDDLRDALPTFINLNMFDALCLWKKSGIGPDFKFSKTPRVFRRGVELEPNSLVPKNVASLKFTNVLDGWIRDQETDQITGEGATSV